MKTNSTSLLIYVLFLPFLSCKNSNTNVAYNEFPIIKIMGSSSETNLINFLSKEYNNPSKKLNIQINGGGSSVGINALINDDIHIATSSRPITAEEYERSQRKGFIPVQTIVALDAIAIISNPDNGIDSLSLLQLTDIFNGKIKNCSEVNGNNMPLRIFGRDNNSGTHQYISSRLNIEHFTSEVSEYADNMQIIEAVKRTKGAIGYINLGSLINTNGKPISEVWAVNLYYEGSRALSPYQKDVIRSGEYPLIRPLFQYTRGIPRNGLKEFIDFELSEEQQNKLEQHGYFPINSIHEAINKKSLNLLN